MMRFSLLAASLAAICVLCVAKARAEPPIALNAVTSVAAAPTDIRSTALVIAESAGVSDAELVGLGQTLAGMNTLVITIEPDWLLDLGGGCSGVVPSLLAIAQEIGAERGAPPRAPVLVGIGAGTALARHAATQAPTKFKGLVTSGLTADQPDPCATPLPAPHRKTALRWHEVAAQEASVLKDVRGVRFYPPQTDKPAQSALVQAYLALAGTDHAFNTDTRAKELDDFPITLHLPEAGAQPPAYVIFLSGDGGWANFDEEIADRLARSGLPVVGISTMRYLWQERKPAKIAADLAQIHHHFSKRFQTERVILAGFSLGANVIPFAAPLLPEEMAQDILGIGLLSPETHTGFEVVMGGWLGQKTGSQDVVAALDALPEMPRVACLHGVEDKHSACPMAQNVQAHRFEGGHHLGKSYDGAARALLSLSSAP